MWSDKFHFLQENEREERERERENQIFINR